MVTLIECNSCHDAKPENMFLSYGPHKKYRAKSCKSCRSIYMKQYRKSKPPEYRIWMGLRERCNCPTNKAYKYYGGRGIDVCKRWDNFNTFMSDMGSRPSSDYDIDRIDNDKGYSPDNCRWATRTQNARNKGNLKLSLEKARVIRNMKQLGERTSVIATRFGITRTMVHYICTGCSWKENA